jgi:hypothetical protein
VLLGVVCLVLGMPALCIAAGLVIVFGLLGWVSTAAAGVLRRVYQPPGTETSIPPAIIEPNRASVDGDDVEFRFGPTSGSK